MNLDLPEEIIAKIFTYLSNPIVASQVCSYWKLVANTQVRKIDLKITSEKPDEIRVLRDALEEFRSLKKLKLELSSDTNNVEKAKFCNRFSNELTHLSLSEMTFLNPFFDDPNISFNNLTSFTIENSDLTSSNQISNFILRCCPRLKHLRLSGCSGLEIETLDYIGQNLNQTQIETFEFLPTYSYYDTAQTPTRHWTIGRLKTFSIRSKLVVMKKNFVKNLIGQRSLELKTLELIAELDLGESLASKVMQNYPNLEKLSLGKGCGVLKNDDFNALCNFYKKLTSFEFHFTQTESSLDLKSLDKNTSIVDLTIGLTKNVSVENVIAIAKNLPNVSRLSIVLYYLSPSNQAFLTLITNIFPQVQHISFQRTGMSENMKFTAIKDEIDSPNLRHFDDIKTLSNWSF